MKVLVIDNYDSFVYNLVHIIEEFKIVEKISVYRNDKLTFDIVDQYDKILLSPGPGLPNEAGMMKNIIERFGSSKSILGICLGHQAIAEVYGATLYNLDDVLHGVEGVLTNYNDKIFNELPNNPKIAHYHSWAVNKNSVEPPLKIIAEDENGLIMGIAHQKYDVKGLQFHPESIMTEAGRQIMSNWIYLK